VELKKPKSRVNKVPISPGTHLLISEEPLGMMMASIEADRQRRLVTGPRRRKESGVRNSWQQRLSRRRRDKIEGNMRRLGSKQGRERQLKSDLRTLSLQHHLNEFNLE
jgi:hypothetical protein